MVNFDPLFRNPHLQTIVSHFWPRPVGRTQHPVSSRFYRTEPDVQVLVTSLTPSSTPKGHLMLVHGLESSGEAGYIRSLSVAAVQAGYAAHSFHMRTCGGTEHLAPTLYHGGLTSDLLAVLREFRREQQEPVFLAGFSLGGNVVLKLAGELGDEAATLVRAVCAVSTPLDLSACARRLSHRENRIYERRFVRRMQARLSATGRYNPQDLAQAHTLLDIDDRFTAPSFGFGTAENYYRTQSAILWVKDIRVPVLLIQSKDDPLVPFDVYERQEVRTNPALRLLVTDHGGHLGFLGRAPHRFWLDDSIVEWMNQSAAG